MLSDLSYAKLHILILERTILKRRGDEGKLYSAHQRPFTLEVDGRRAAMDI
jgi:hypothetical protein